MATSVADLLGAMDALAHGTVDRRRADDAVLAIGELGRALMGLRHDGLHHRPGGVRDIAVGEVASACHAAGAVWRGECPGRLADLAAAVADVVGGLRFKAGLEERWALATGVADVARRLAQFARVHQPYRAIPPLTRVTNTAVTVARLAARTPPAPRAGALLDAPVASAPAGVPRASDAVLCLVADIDAAERRLQPLRLGEVLAITRVGEEAARICGQGTSAEPCRQAPAAWWAVGSSLAVFDDGTRRRPPHGDLLRHVLDLHAGLRAPLDTQEQCVVANQLPVLARHLRRTTTQWGRAGLLIVRADRRPPQPHRVDAFLNRTHVRVTEQDLEPVRRTIYTATLLSTALAAELDREAVPAGVQPQPHLAAAYATQIANLRCAETLARRAAAVARRRDEARVATGRACQSPVAARRSM